jgi:hypothetical protein
MLCWSRASVLGGAAAAAALRNGASHNTPNVRARNIANSCALQRVPPCVPRGAAARHDVNAASDARGAGSAPQGACGCAMMR